MFRLVAFGYPVQVHAAPQLVRTVGLSLFLCLSLATADARSQDAAPDASSAMDEADATPPPPCAQDAGKAVTAVRAVFQRMATLYEESLPPGPAGLSYRESRSHSLIDELADTEAFASSILDGLILQPTEETAQALVLWERVLGALLQERLRKRLRDPRGHTLEIQEASVDCRRARVVVSLHKHGSDRGAAQVVLSLVLRHEGWRIYDMAVEGIGLVRTWRNRLERIRRDHGMAGVHRQMRTMQRKLGVRTVVEVPIP